MGSRIVWETGKRVLVDGMVRHKCLAVPVIIGRIVARQVGGWSIQTRNNGANKV